MAEKLNHHNDPAGLARSMRHATSCKKNLGNMNDLEGLFRQLSGDVIDRFVNVGHGLLTQAEAIEKDRLACHDTAKVLSGGDPSWAPVPGWTGHGMAAYLRAQMKSIVSETDDDTSVVASAVGVFVQRIYGLLSKTEAGNGEAIAQEVEENIRSISWTLGARRL